MNHQITKSDFLKYLDCPAYLWFYKNKPEVLEDQELSDFQQELIKNGQEVEAWARKLFPRGVLVESREDQAVADTKKLLADGSKVIFQATFKADGLYVMVDILEWNEDGQYWIINEVKGSSSKEVKKEKNIYDAAFQYLVLQRAGYKVGRVNLIELNKDFCKQGEIDVVKLLEVTDITEQAVALQEEIGLMKTDMERLMAREIEPMPCDCIYKSRSNQCPAFKYLHPEVPDYSVHDIVRIGSSPARLERLIEGGYYSIDDIPEDFELTELQRNHVDVTQKRTPIIKTAVISKELGTLNYPLYFLDYETYPTAIPIYDGCRPYQQVPFQYSLHVQRALGGELEHYEYLHTDGASHPMKGLADHLMRHIGEEGNVVVWNKKFEGKCHEDLADLLPEYAEVFIGYNKRFFDLMEIFSKNLYVHHDFRGSYSIKAVLPVLVPKLSYTALSVRDGSMAMGAWKAMIFGAKDQSKKDQIKHDLLEYCKMDTYAMVRILEAIEKL